MNKKGSNTRRKREVLWVGLWSNNHQNWVIVFVSYGDILFVYKLHENEAS